MDCSSSTNLRFEYISKFQIKSICMLCRTVKVYWLFGFNLSLNLSQFIANNWTSNDIDLSMTKSLTYLSLTKVSLSQVLFDKIMVVIIWKLWRGNLDLSYINIGELLNKSFSKFKVPEFIFLRFANITNIQLFGTFSQQHALQELDIFNNESFRLEHNFPDEQFARSFQQPKNKINRYRVCPCEVYTIKVDRLV